MLRKSSQTSSLKQPPLASTPNRHNNPSTLHPSRPLTPLNSQVIRTISSTTNSTNVSFQSRQIQEVIKNNPQQDGVGVTIYRSIGVSPRYYDPFAMLDYFHLKEGSLDKGVGFHPHPHRGIATLTYMLPFKDNGRFVHQDHKGNGGIIGPGDVQFMSAGKGIVHSEMPADNRSVQGLQLWLNLHKDNKMSEPTYQDYLAKDIPNYHADGIHARVIAGEAFGLKSELRTPSPIHYVHVTMDPNSTLQHAIPSDYNAFMYALRGDGKVIDSTADGTETTTDIPEAHTILFTQMKTLPHGVNSTEPHDVRPSGVHLKSGPSGFEYILIAGAPLDDNADVVPYGPMIMNSPAEINQAFRDFRNGANGFEGAREFEQNWSPPKPLPPM